MGGVACTITASPCGTRNSQNTFFWAPTAASAATFTGNTTSVAVAGNSSSGASTLAGRPRSRAFAFPENWPGFCTFQTIFVSCPCSTPVSSAAISTTGSATFSVISPVDTSISPSPRESAFG